MDPCATVPVETTMERGNPMRYLAISTLFALASIACADEAKPASQPDPDQVVAGAFGRRLSEAVRGTKGFAGTALVAKDGAILLAKGYGYADTASKRRCLNTPRRPLRAGTSARPSASR